MGGALGCVRAGPGLAGTSRGLARDRGGRKTRAGAVHWTAPKAALEQFRPCFPDPALNHGGLETRPTPPTRPAQASLHLGFTRLQPPSDCCDGSDTDASGSPRAALLVASRYRQAGVTGPLGLGQPRATWRVMRAEGNRRKRGDVVDGLFEIL